MSGEFNYKEKILQYIKSKNKETQIIGLFMKAKGMCPENKEQFESIYKRNIKQARELACYKIEKIILTMKYLIDNAEYKWTLESVAKHIDEDLHKLLGIDTIITLKNGEKIYDIERIKQLEREGKIYYTGKRWKEVD